MRNINKKKKKRNLKQQSIQDQEGFTRRIFVRRSLFILVVLLILLFCLLVKIAYIQFIEGNNYSTLAYKQQTKSQVISPKRGTIYDKNGKVLAKNTAVSTISVNPRKDYLLR